ncbi:MAG: hypothetical protein MI924_30040 [Chloroflexales bacterium]|nr:hypothetical protein [Chloroflexales bacterium]
MSQRPQGSLSGIFSLAFREVGLFCEQAFKWAEEQAAEDRIENAKDTERRRMEAETRLLEQARLAKEAGLDVDKIMARFRGEPKRLP